MTPVRFLTTTTLLLLGTSTGLLNCGGSDDPEPFDNSGGAGESNSGDGDGDQAGDGDGGDGDALGDGDAPGDGDSPGDGDMGGASGDGDGDTGTGGDGSGQSGAVPCDSDENCLGMNQVCDFTRGLCADCVEYTDCPEGSTCQHGTCEAFTSCESSLDCGSPDLVCVQNEVLGGLCLDCAMPADCDDGSMCVSNECHVACDSDQDCFDENQLCNFGGGFCADCVDGLGCEDDEYCDGLSCRPHLCVPGSTECLETALVTCNEEGSGFLAPVSCNGFDCTMSGGEAKCDYPESVKPEGALNENGDFAAGGVGWHLDMTSPAPVTDGMFCMDGAYTSDFGWPSEVADAVVLEVDQAYRLTFRTVFTTEQVVPTFSVKLGLPETPYTEFFTQMVDVSEGVQDHELTFTMQNATSSAGIVFSMGVASGVICVDDVWLVPVED